MKRIRLHVQTFSHRPALYRITPERWAAAAARHAELAARLDVTFDDEAGLGTAEIALGVPADRNRLADRAPRLRWLHHAMAGVDALLPFDWLPSSIVLTNNRGAHGAKAQEYMRMAYTALNLGLTRMIANQQARRWEQIFSPRLAGQTAVVVGLGDLGMAAVRAAGELGLKVIGVRRHARPCDGTERTVTFDAIDSVLPAADYVVLATPLTPETRGLLNAARLRLMKPTAGVINIARAAVADYDALVAALREGRLAGAVLDVASPEPLPADAPLWSAPNVLLTPHISCDDAADYVEVSLELWFANLARYVAHEPLAAVVDRSLGY